MDGLWLNRVLGLAPVDGERMDRIRHALQMLLTLAPPGGAQGAPAPDAGVRAGRDGARSRK
jgi:hypothetical protein